MSPRGLTSLTQRDWMSTGNGRRHTMGSACLVKSKITPPHSSFSSVGCLSDGLGVTHHLRNGGGTGCDVPCQPFPVAEFVPGGTVHFDAIGRSGRHQCCLNVAKHSLSTWDGQHHNPQFPQNFPPSLPRESSLALHLLQHSRQSRDSVLGEVDSSTDLVNNPP